MLTAPPPITAPRPHRPGFTLIELLVVISIIALLTGLTFPTLRATLQGTTVQMASNQVSNSLSAARVFATQTRPFIAARRVGQSLLSAQDVGDGYSGAVVLFSADNTLRILQNDENAFDTDAAGTATPWMELQNPPANGYAPVPDVEDLRLPGRVALLGIRRTGPGDHDIELIPAPFAIRFSRNGHIAEGQAEDRLPVGTSSPTSTRVVYVSDADRTSNVARSGNPIIVNEYRTSNERSDVTTFPQLDLGRFGPGGTETGDTDGRVRVPFTKIETVIGALIVDPSRVPAQANDPRPTGTFGDTTYTRDQLEPYGQDESLRILEWARRNATFGRILFFNRNTGQDLTR